MLFEELVLSEDQQALMRRGRVRVRFVGQGRKAARDREEDRGSKGEATLCRLQISERRDVILARWF